MRRQVWLGLCFMIGCARPVVDPRGPGPIIPNQSISPSSSRVPSLQTSGGLNSDVQPVQTESVIQLPIESQNETYHTVQAGETLGSIATRYGVSVERLQTANGLDASAALQARQLLFIPRNR